MRCFIILIFLIVNLASCKLQLANPITNNELRFQKDFKKLSGTWQAVLSDGLKLVIDVHELDSETEQLSVTVTSDFDKYQFNVYIAKVEDNYIISVPIDVFLEQNIGTGYVLYKGQFSNNTLAITPWDINVFEAHFSHLIERKKSFKDKQQSESVTGISYKSVIDTTVQNEIMSELSKNLDLFFNEADTVNFIPK